MKAIIVDDEKLAVHQMERMLSRYEDVEVLGKFQDAGEAIKQAKELQPDVAFLDIQMPEYTGLQAAVLLQEACPAIEIVFATAYDIYAVQAYELDASDYVMKPLRQNRLDQTIERIRRRLGEPASKRERARAYGINCFQTLRFQYKGKAAEVPKWRTAKSLELFAYLLHYRGEVVRKSVLLELLWPELDKKRAMTQLYTAIYLIRQCLAKMNMDITIANLSIQEGYMLDVSRIAIETEVWEKELLRLDGSLEVCHEELVQTLDRYEGDYLKDYDYLWAEPERERLRKLWLHNARRLAGYYAASIERRAEAVHLLEKIQSLDPYNEEEAMLVLKLYDEAGEYDKVTARYRLLCDAYTLDLGLGKPAEAEKWFEAWRSALALPGEIG